MDSTRETDKGPAQSATDGTQLAGPDNPPAPTAALAGEFLPANSLSALAQAHPQKFGGEVQAGILSLLLERDRQQIEELKAELAEARAEAKLTATARNALELSNAALRTEIRVGGDASQKRVYATLCGTALLSLSLDSWKTGLIIETVGLFILGLALAGFGLWSPRVKELPNDR